MAQDEGIYQPQAPPEGADRSRFWTSMLDAIENKDRKKGVTAIAELATKNNGVPEDVMKKLSTWTDEQKKTLASFLSAESVEGVANEAREHLRNLAKTMNLGQVPEFGVETTANSINKFVDKNIIEKLGLKGMIPETAKRFGFKSGSATNFLKGFFIGGIAKGFERMAFAMSAYSANVESMLKTPMDLRMGMLDITKADEQKTFKDAYMAQVTRAGGNYKNFKAPTNLQEAYAIVSPVSKETLVAAKTADTSGKQPWELNPTTNTVGPPTTTVAQNNPETKPNTATAAA